MAQPPSAFKSNYFLLGVGKPNEPVKLFMSKHGIRISGFIKTKLRFRDIASTIQIRQETQNWNYQGEQSWYQS